MEFPSWLISLFTPDSSRRKRRSKDEEEEEIDGGVALGMI